MAIESASSYICFTAFVFCKKVLLWGADNEVAIRKITFMFCFQTLKNHHTIAGHINCPYPCPEFFFALVFVLSISKLVFVFVIVFVLVLCNLWPWELYSVALSGFLQYCAHRSMAFTRLSKKGLANNARLDFADMVFTQRTRLFGFITNEYLPLNACMNFILLWFQSPNPWHNLALGLALPPPAAFWFQCQTLSIMVFFFCSWNKFVFRRGHKNCNFTPNAGIWS